MREYFWPHTVYSNISDKITCFHNFVIITSIIIFSQNSTPGLTANIYLIINGIFFAPSYILVIFIMESEKKKRPPNFRLEIPGDENYKIVIQEKSQIVNEFLDQDFLDQDSEETCQQFPCN